MKNEARLIELADGVIAALRHELHEYGAMLALLDAQQQAVIGRAGDEVLQSVTRINEQTQMVERARGARESCRRELAVLICKPEGTTFTQMIPLLPEKFRGAVQALIRENNDLLTRVRQRARQNHLLISRSLELMQRVLTAFTPATSPAVYTESGKTLEARPSAPLYDAVG